MRLLAIRGAQLASLGTFAVELNREPLNESRIFAIVGPTGAGKSTLLDAICLALYDRVPRLLDAREAAVGTDDLSPNDPRSLMRRGAAEAYAEVDFVDRHGTRCRARWDVWRARRRADGRIQNQRVSLTDLDHERDLTEATKTETLRQIETRLGLSFEEFRRAVLLAQGDFSAFLRAQADERANLLEKMTGTHLFGALSRAAHARHREAAEALTRAEVMLAGVDVLSDEARAELDGEHETRTARRADLAQARTRAQAQVRWHDEHRALVEAATAADDAAREAHAAAAAAAEEQRTLDRAEAAELLRAPFQVWSQAERGAVEARGRRQQVTQQLDETRTLVAAADEALAAATEAQAEQRARETHQAAALARARDLDGRVAEARAAAEQTRAQLGTCEDAATAARATLDEQLSQYETAVDELRGVEAWLDQRMALKPVAGQWPTIDGALARGAELTTRAIQLAAETEALGTKLRASTEDHARTQATLRAAADDLERGQVALHDAQTALAELRGRVPPRDRRDAMETLAELRAGIERLRALLPNARRLDRRIKEEARARRMALKHAKDARRRLDEARVQQRNLKEQLTHAEAAVTRAEAVQTVAERRAELLVAGEPCPLCGSLTHPAAHHDPPDNPRLASLRARRTRLDNELGQARQTTDAARTALRTHRLDARDAQVRSDEATSDLEVLNQTWASGRDALKLVWLRSALLTQRGVHKLYLAIDESPTAKDAQSGLKAALDGLDAARADLADWAEREDELAQAVELERAARDEQEATRRSVAEQLGALDRTLTDLSHARDQLVERRSAAETEWTRALETVRPPLSAAVDMARVAREPAAVRTELAAAVPAYEAQRASGETLAARLRTLSDRVAETRRTADQALAALDDGRRRHAQTTDRARILVEERATLLGGETVDAFEAKSRAARATAEEAIEAARLARAEAESRQAAAAGRRDDADAQLAQAETARAQYQTQLDRSLAASGFTLDEVRHHLTAHDAAWRSETRARLQSAKDRQTGAQAQAEAARQGLDRHRATGAPDRSPEEAAQALASIQDAYDAEVAALGRLEERRRRDDEARRARADLDQSVEVHRRRLDEWSELNAVIGSADGRRLRSFAQGLTLESLVLQANLHLQQLRPRYRLERVPHQDMDLMVVDRDLGDEARALSSLSGGETFLVSLALALALSTLSARDVRIESLFIDEGFGALDAEALEVALATLDQLQAEGRMIGLISHIPDLAERIGYRVEVQPTGPGTSEVRVRGA